MEVRNLKHDKALIEASLTVLDDHSVICNRDMEVYIPKRFVENGMAQVSERITTAAVLGLVIPGVAYAPLVALAEVILAPLNIREVSVNGDLYMVLEFSKGDTLIESLEVMQDPNFAYTYHLEFDFYAKVPWYVNKDVLTALFDNAKKETGSSVGSSPQVIRVLKALMLRDPDNLAITYRNSKAMLAGKEPVIVGLNNSAMLIDGTFPKIMGGYLRDNTLAAIVNPDTKVTDLEKVIKGIPDE